MIDGLWFIIPAYFASSSAVIFGKISKKPLDLNKNFIDGRRIFGESKTITGFIGAVSFGTLIAYLQSSLEILFNLNFGLSMTLTLGFLVSFGGMCGDLGNSFLKRRLGIKSGDKFFPMDQLNLAAGGLLFGAFMMIPSFNGVVFLIFFTVAMHVLFNWIAFKLRLKSVPW